MRAATVLRLSLVIVLVLGGPALADEPASQPAGPDPDAPSVRLLAMREGQPVVIPKVKVGEPFHVVVTAVPRPDVVVNLPASFDTPSFEVVERRELPLVAGSPERSFDLTVVAWEAGTLTFPPLPVTYVSKGQVKQVLTGGLTVEVNAVVREDDKSQAPRPIAPPVPVLERDYTLVWIGVGLAGGAAVWGAATMALARLRRRRRRVAAAVAEAADNRPADEIALEKLRALARSGLLDASDLRPFAFQLTEIVREFLGRRFGFDALELTTTELLETLRRAPGAEVLLADLEVWLYDLDLVKYAGVKASRAEAQAALDQALALVERVRPVVMTPPAPPAGPTTPGEPSSPGSGGSGPGTAASEVAGG
jgi:hypothetical protein